MGWKQFLTPVKSINADEARAFISDNEEGSYTLLDVRQPSEYEEERITGAKLIPLPELTERLDEIDSDKPIIVY
jgi:rhodanese-related sulfurtransferase